jgi:gas vesicle protein
MRRILSFIAGILAGGSLGAGIALLFSPQSGDEMRQSLRERVTELKTNSSIAAAEKEAELRQELATLTQQNVPATQVDTAIDANPNGSSPTV